MLRLPVRVGNDAELGALAEHVRGVARGATDLVYVSADFGVGGGVISEGRPLRGARGYVGEIGHLVVRPGGRPCYCGSRGCWETEVGEAALLRALGLPEATTRGVDRRRAAGAGGRPAAGRAPTRSTSSLSGSPSAWSRWSTCSLHSSWCSATCSPRCPARVVDEVRAMVHERSLVSRAVGGTRIEISPLGRDAKLVGAAELAFEPVLGAV